MDKRSFPRSIPRILVVDHDGLIRAQLERLFTHIGLTVLLVASVEKAQEQLGLDDVDLVVTEIQFPGLGGVELIKWVQQTCPGVPVIVITAQNNLETAVTVLKLGASDYIVKPFSEETIQESTQAALEKASFFIETRSLRRAVRDSCEFEGMLSKNPGMHRVFEIIRMVSAMDVTVLLEGETGTGKEMVAKAIHCRGRRREGSLIPINCAGLPEPLLESELFGYERGAFTGADQARAGKIELAHGGTLFLDEIESMSLSMQAKLLRVLEDKKVQRLGGCRVTQVDIRVIAASNVRLKDLVTQGRMRRDFYYRINVISIHLIPLRQRREDIPLLVQTFLQKNSFARQKGITEISRRAMAQLMQYSWPGNVRELQNVLEKSIVLSKWQVLQEVDLSDELSQPQEAGERISLSLPLSQWIVEMERQYLMQKLNSCGGKLVPTATSCGISVRTLSRRMQLYGLNRRTAHLKLKDS
ncbi:MAG: sigma-54-dependent Fis family transcriptional regulator [Deltaproteobacteria bacterium]|nr:sigma-54-dependent Fis family transcriptional regulator [Deltaproteobacteria bacterium]